MQPAALSLRHAADAPRIDAAVRAGATGLLPVRLPGAASLLLDLPIGCRA